MILFLEQILVCDSILCLYCTIPRRSPSLPSIACFCTPSGPICCIRWLSDLISLSTLHPYAILIIVFTGLILLMLFLAAVSVSLFRCPLTSYSLSIHVLKWPWIFPWHFCFLDLIIHFSTVFPCYLCCSFLLLYLVSLYPVLLGLVWFLCLMAYQLFLGDLMPNPFS